MCDGTVYVRALNRHELYSIDTSTGELNWKYAPGISEGRRLDPVTVEGDTVLVKQNAIIVFNQRKDRRDQLYLTMLAISRIFISGP